MLLLKKGNLDDAEKILEKAELLSPDSTAVKTAKSQLCIAKGDRETAETILKDLIKSDPGNYPLIINYTDVLKGQGRYEDALKTLKSLQRGYAELS